MSLPIDLKTRQRRMVGHGAWIMVVALSAGLGLIPSLLGGIEVWPGHMLEFRMPGDPSAWARAHVGGLLNALMVMVVALLLPILEFDRTRERTVSGWIVGAAWANSFFYWAAIWAPNRALTLGSNRFGSANAASILGFVPVLVFVVLTLIAVVLIARQAWRKQGGRPTRDVPAASTPIRRPLAASCKSLVSKDGARHCR